MKATKVPNTKIRVTIKVALILVIGSFFLTPHIIYQDPIRVASKSPFKVKPPDRGGLRINYADRKIYELLDD